MYHTHMRASHTNITNTHTVDINHLLADPVAVGIVAAADRAELTMQELAALFRVREQRLVRRVRALVAAGALTVQRRRGPLVYAAGEP